MDLWMEGYQQERERGQENSQSRKNRYNLLEWLLILLWLWYVWRAALQTVWHSSLIMEFWMNNVLRMQGNNGCEVLHLFLQRLRLLPLRCSVFKNLASTGHRQLCGPATVSPLKIPLIIIPPFPSLHIWLREIFCIVFTAFGFDTSYGFAGIWCYLTVCIVRPNILMSGAKEGCNLFSVNLHYVCREQKTNGTLNNLFEGLMCVFDCQWKMNVLSKQLDRRSIP